MPHFQVFGCYHVARRRQKEVSLRVSWESRVEGMLPREFLMLRSLFLISAMVLVSVGTIGCQQQSPLEQLEAARASYTVEVSSFSIREEPIEPAVETQADAGTPGEAADGGADLSGILEPQLKTDVLLDVIVSTDSENTLEGVTVDYEHVDAGQNVKDSRKLWIDTSAVVRGAGSQVTLVVENVDYVEGDGFFVAVLSPVPLAEQSEYREFLSLQSP